jgi:hypothetical protein
VGSSRGEPFATGDHAVPAESFVLAGRDAGCGGAADAEPGIGHAETVMNCANETDVLFMGEQGDNAEPTVPPSSSVEVACPGATDTDPSW